MKAQPVENKFTSDSDSAYQVAHMSDACDPTEGEAEETFVLDSIEVPEAFAFDYSLAFDGENAEKRSEEHPIRQIIQNHQPEENAPDTLNVTIAYTLEKQQKDSSEASLGLTETELMPISVRLYAVPGGIAFKSSDSFYRIATIGSEIKALRQQVAKRNRRYGWETPPELFQPEKKERLQELLTAPDLLPQPTFYEARTGATAISDGRDLRDWRATEGMIAMLHAPKDSSMQTRFEPCSLLLGLWGKQTGAELETLQNELQNLAFDALVTYFVCLSWAVENYQVTTSLDAIIEAIGRGKDARRSAKSRQELRAKVWRWLLLFDSLAVIGARRGTWREPRDGDKKREKIDPAKLYSRDALLKIIGTRDTEQGTFDNSAPPKEVTFIAGAWVNQWRGNREMLSEFGNVRAIASIPRGKPSGAWAACIGFALNQKWREGAAKTPITRISKGGKKLATQKFRPFTRRVLLAQLWRSDVDPMEILNSSDPSRAKEYWDAAIGILKTDGIIGFYKEIKPLAATGYGWQDEWLDQPLDIRPSGDGCKDAMEISKSASVARRRSGKKSAPKTPEAPKSD